MWLKKKKEEETEEVFGKETPARTQGCSKGKEGVLGTAGLRGPSWSPRI